MCRMEPCRLVLAHMLGRGRYHHLWTPHQVMSWETANWPWLTFKLNVQGQFGKHSTFSFTCSFHSQNGDFWETVMSGKDAIILTSRVFGDLVWFGIRLKNLTRCWKGSKECLMECVSGQLSLFRHSLERPMELGYGEQNIDLTLLYGEAAFPSVWGVKRDRDERPVTQPDGRQHVEQNEHELWLLQVWHLNLSTLCPALWFWASVSG